METKEVLGDFSHVGFLDRPHPSLAYLNTDRK